MTAATAAADATAEVVETVIDNSGKTLAYVATVVGAAFAVGWVIRHYGERLTAGAPNVVDEPPEYIYVEAPEEAGEWVDPMDTVQDGDPYDTGEAQGANEHVR